MALISKSAEPVADVTVTATLDTDRPDELDVRVSNTSNMLLIANAPLADAILDRTISQLEAAIDAELASA